MVGRSGSEAAHFAGYVGLEQHIERSVIAHPEPTAHVAHVGATRDWRTRVV